MSIFDTFNSLDIKLIICTKFRSILKKILFFFLVSSYYLQTNKQKKVKKIKDGFCDH